MYIAKVPFYFFFFFPVKFLQTYHFKLQCTVECFMFIQTETLSPKWVSLAVSCKLLASLAKRTTGLPTANSKRAFPMPISTQICSSQYSIIKEKQRCIHHWYRVYCVLLYFNASQSHLALSSLPVIVTSTDTKAYGYAKLLL